MAVLMLATISIKSAVGESISYAKETLSGVVYLQADMTSLRDKAMQDMQGDNPPSSTEQTRIAVERPTISIDMAKDLADSEYVKDYTYSINSSANATDGIVPSETEQIRMREQIQSQSESSGSSNFPGGNMGMGGGGMMSFSFASGDFSIQGINSFAFISEVDAGTMSLESGEIFDETTGDGIVISYDLAVENSFEIGDIITLETTDEDEPAQISLTIIGIYDTTTENSDPNTIYTNIDTAALFLLEDSYNDVGSYGVENVKYFLTNAEYKDAFIAEANEKYDLDDLGLAIDIDDAAYQQMVGPIESVGSFATTILWIVIIAAVVIITLMVTINIKDRRYEMGVLMSIGATKKNITGQILTELALVGTVAFALSILPSTFIAKAMGSGLLDQQLTMNETSQSQNFGRGTNSGGMGGGRGGASNSGGPSFNTNDAPSSVPTNMIQGVTNSNAEAIDEIDVSPSATDYLILFLAGYGVIIFALIIPTINVLRFQPKTILTGKE